MPNSIIGKDDHLITYLDESISEAKKIRFIVSFLMESGAKMIASHLQEAARRGVDIQILTGKYLSITEPSAIYYLIDKLGDQLDIRFFANNLLSFHTKAYLFEYENDAEIFIGSSNLSKSALTSGIEWNYRFKKSEKPEDYLRFNNAFEELFNNQSIEITSKILKEYSSDWKKSKFIKLEESLAEEELNEQQLPSPRGAQIEALYELKIAREEGISKGLVIAATGVGKTYLAAFDSISFNRILFIAHREEILFNAEKTFKSIRTNDKTGFFTGTRKDEHADIYFATIQTLSRAENLLFFKPDFFEYIIVDEFHHAAADSYISVLKYFTTNFLLGLTATPYRTDNRDIFALCDDNVIYEIYLKDAINRDLLVPFKYYGLYDNTDYSKIEQRSGNYVIEDLERKLSIIDRAKLVLDNYNKFAKSRTIGFCASIKHADYMAEYFNINGVSAAAVHSGKRSENGVKRSDAINAIEQGDLQVIFTVDIFNEGVDIPSIDTVMFIRPTESFVVFLQQLGRGLRKHEGKDYLTVLDFIGNYKKAHYIPALLAGDNPMDLKRNKGKDPIDFEYPEGCNIQFDFKVLDLFKELSINDPLNLRMKNEYFSLKEKLGRRPNRLDIYEGSDIPIREYLKKGWLQFLIEIDDQVPEEESWIGTEVEEFLLEIEKTHMSKAYKIPTINSLFENNTISSYVSLERIGQNFMRFYKDVSLHQKDLKDKSNKNWRNWDIGQFEKLAKNNPIKFLSKSKFFHYDEINKVFSISSNLKPYLTPLLAEHLRDILEYKRVNYFSKRYKEEN